MKTLPMKTTRQLFGLKTTEYLRQTSSVDIKMSEKVEKTKILAWLLHQNLSPLTLVVINRFVWHTSIRSRTKPKHSFP